MDRRTIARVLLELLEEETGEKHPDLDESADLRKDVHLDSLDMVSLVLHIENRFEIEIDTEELAASTSVGRLLDILEAKINGQSGARAA